MRTTTTTTTTTTYRNIGEYVWNKYSDGSLDVYWANDAEYSQAIYGRFVIDPTLHTVYRYKDDDTAEYAAAIGSHPGSEDYFLQAETIDRDTGETGYVAYRGSHSWTRVAASDDWRTLAQAVNDDMEEQGIFGSVYLEDRYHPELLEFVGLPDGPLGFKRADVPVSVDEWTV